MALYGFVPKKLAAEYKRLFRSEDFELIAENSKYKDSTVRGVLVRRERPLNLKNQVIYQQAQKRALEILEESRVELNKES